METTSIADLWEIRNQSLECLHRAYEILDKKEKTRKHKHDEKRNNIL
jgi:hypothetical protein